MKHILLVRSGPYQVDPTSYNLQEIGLAAAFSKYNIKCDVVYYHASRNYDEKIVKNGTEVNVLWRKGIRILRSGVYPTLLKKSFLSSYDAVICSEYSQIMSVLFLKRIKTFIYNGPYYNLFRIPFIEPVYDSLFSSFINQHAKKVFCKTKAAEKYLNAKGIDNTLVTGVGLDTEKFDKLSEPNSQVKSLLKRMQNHKSLLYIGSISKRKNVDFLIRVFNRINNNREKNNLQLIIIGNGKNRYTKYCHSLVNRYSKGKIIWINHIDNSQAKYIYQHADLFLLPSIKEIFGMVLLESMYFGLPVISSNNAGANTLINNEKNGFIIKEFDEQRWANRIVTILNDKKSLDNIGEKAKKTILNNFMWDNIALKMSRYI